MAGVTYEERRNALETYFDRTAVDAWAKLTSEAPVSGVRATVRAGRDSIRAVFLDWSPADMIGERVLDAGCGAGQLAFALAARGAAVEAVDLSPTLLELAADRTPTDLPGTVTFRAGDMLDPSGGPVDRVVAMDSLIHYGLDDMVEMLIGLSRRAEKSIIFTFAPRTPALTVMHAAGKLFPKSDRSPAIIPVGERALRKRIEACEALKDWRVGRTERIDSFFYISQAMELVRA